MRSLYRPALSALFVFMTFVSCSTNPVFGQEQDSLRYWKGNLHTHSFWSDGTDFPEMIAKWYRDRDYDFLSLTDHNILSRGEKWMSLETIIKRAGEDCVEKYQETIGSDWVEFRESDVEGADEEPKVEVRLKTLEETRSKFETPGEFILIEGEEITDSVNRLPVHMNAVNLDAILRPVGGSTVREAMQNNLRQAEKLARESNRPIMVHLNHPNFGWAITAEDIAAVTNEKFFEIFNGHPGVNQLGDDEHPSIEKMWDIINVLRMTKLKAAPIFGLGTDDSHEYHGRPGSRPGRAWVMIRAKSLDAKSLIESMNRGDFYSSSGITLKSIFFDPEKQTLQIEIDGEEGVTYETRFVGTRMDAKLLADAPETDSASEPKEPETKTEDGEKDADVENADDKIEPEESPIKSYSDEVGAVFATSDSLTPTFQFMGDELYVRAIITSSKSHPDPSFKDQFEQAWTQPMGWEAKLQSSATSDAK